MFAASVVAVPVARPVIFLADIGKVVVIEEIPTLVPVKVVMVDVPMEAAVAVMLETVMVETSMPATYSDPVWRVNELVLILTKRTLAA